MKFSVINNNRNVVGQLSITQYVDHIKSKPGRIPEYRKLLESGDKEATDRLKISMPAITPAGIFYKIRNNNTIEEYSGNVCIDIDKVDVQGLEIDLIKKEIEKDKYVHIVHRSVGGNGLAVFVKVDSSAGMHSSAYAQVADYLSKKYSIKVDPSCKEISRQRYFSYDPDIYWNHDSSVFELTDQPVFETIKDQYGFTENLHKMEEGTRNVFLHQLACNCARTGVPSKELKKYVNDRYAAADFTVREILSTIDSGYKSVDKSVYDSDSAQSALSAQSAVAAYLPSLSEFSDLTFENWIFPKLPYFFQGYDLITNNDIQRDIAFISKLGILSACLSSVFTIYRGGRNYPNLYFLIYAPPACDKSIMGMILKIADPLDTMMTEECARRMHEYNNSGSDEEEEPKCKGLYLDADSSAIAMIQNLAKGQENLLADTEGVILSQIKKNDWAQLDPPLRKAFHFERISVSRKDKTITIRDPRISLLMTCTVEDARVFSGSIQGGLTSRILPYSFSNTMKWQNQFTVESSRIPDFIDTKAMELIEIYQFNKKYPFELKFTDIQKQKHTDTFGDWTDELDSGDEFAFLKRLGVATVRIAMIITAVKKYEAKNEESNVICEDTIFDISLSIANTFRGHGSNFYKLLSQKTVAVPRLQKVVDALSQQFTTQEFITQCKQMLHINNRQAMKHLVSMVENGVLSHIKQGVYEKL
jgi:hypothetical protein